MKGYKTFTFACLQAVAILSLPQVQEWVTLHPTYTILGNSTIIAILRYYSTTAIFNKDDTK